MAIVTMDGYTYGTTQTITTARPQMGPVMGKIIADVHRAYAKAVVVAPLIDKKPEKTLLGGQGDTIISHEMTSTPSPVQLTNSNFFSTVSPQNFGFSPSYLSINRMFVYPFSIYAGDKVFSQGIEGEYDIYVDEAIQALVGQLETDIMALYAGMTTDYDSSQAGGAGEHYYYFEDAAKIKRLFTENRVPSEPRYAILSPYDAQKFLLKTTADKYPLYPVDWMNGAIGKLWGFYHLESPNVAYTEAAGIRTYNNIVFHPDAIEMAMKIMLPYNYQSFQSTDYAIMMDPRGGLSICLEHDESTNPAAHNYRLKIGYGLRVKRQEACVHLTSTEAIV
jgi:hypothetical protein